MSKKLPVFRYSDYEAVIPLSLIDQNEGQIPDVPSNPRFVRDEKFDALVRSIEEDPEMLYLNEIKVYPMDGRYVAIGGNQRTKALLFLDIDEIKCKVLDPASPASRIRRIINKDNYGYGENDQKILHDEWAEFMDEFEEMGMDDIFMDDIEEEIEENADDFSSKNREIDTDDFDEKMTIKLQFSVDEHRFVRERLAVYDANIEQALLKVLGYEGE